MRTWLIDLRKKRKMTQAEVAQKAYLSQSYYAEIETGARGKALKVATAKAIAAVLDFDWQQFYQDD